MFRPLALYIGLRYTRTNRRNHFVSFISLSSMLGIAIGVAVLITVLSVMNGFDEEIHDRFFSMAAQVTVNSYTGTIADWQAIEEQVAEFPGVTGVAPFVGGQGLLTHLGEILPIIVSGIFPERESAVSSLADSIVVGELDELQAGSFSIIVGQEIAAQLGLLVGDKVTLMIPQAAVTPVGLLPRFKRFTVGGIFSAGSGFGFDKSLAFIHLADAQTLLQIGDDVSGLRVRINNIYAAPQMSIGLMEQLPEGYLVGNWTQEYGAFFSAVKLEKNMMFLILTLIIAVAAFNLVSSLVMVVNDKQADIAILRTLGARPKTILTIFMVQGTIVGVTGMVLGLIGGIVLALNATAVVSWLQNVLQLQVLSSGVYFVDYLPSQIQWQDILQVSIIALLMSFVATLYPAWRAARTQPAEALRYE